MDTWAPLQHLIVVWRNEYRVLPCWDEQLILHNDLKRQEGIDSFSATKSSSTRTMGLLRFETLLRRKKTCTNTEHHAVMPYQNLQWPINDSLTWPTGREIRRIG